MPYDYYCTGCGKKLNNGVVLFDLSKVLSDEPLNLLRFRLTEKELLGLCGNELKGFHKVKLSFGELMAYLANENNFTSAKREDVASLTKQEVDEYLQRNTGATVTMTAATQESGAFSGLFGGLFGSFAGEDVSCGLSSFDVFPEITPAGEEAAAEDEYEIPAGILALLKLDTFVNAEEKTKDLVNNDLKVLQRLFQGRNDEEVALEFDIKLHTEDDDEGNLVITGVMLKDRQGVFYDLDNNRVCPHCGTRILRRAGTAKHKSVVFIGYPNSGKTDTILALTHYSMNRMALNLEDPIWKDTPGMGEVDDIENLDMCDRLQAELKNYALGISPAKTQLDINVNAAEGRAYSSTFYLRSSAGEKSEARIITFIDLPGELFDKYGTIHTTEFETNWSVALACDAIVLCFDTNRVKPVHTQLMEGIKCGMGEEEAEKMIIEPATFIQNTIRWADAFQRHVKQSRKTDGYVPTMLLFTKCPDVEKPQGPVHMKPDNNPLSRCYMLREEQYLIAQNSICKTITEAFIRSGELSKAYLAMLRCSAYGNKAPSENDPAVNEKCRRPAPYGIYELTRWLLSVCGALPVKAEYIIPNSPNTYRLENYYLPENQYREQLPDKRGRWNNAMARVYLFINPGYFDREYVRRSGMKLRTRFLDIEARVKPDNLR